MDYDVMMCWMLKSAYDHASLVSPPETQMLVFWGTTRLFAEDVTRSGNGDGRKEFTKPRVKMKWSIPGFLPETQPPFGRMIVMIVIWYSKIGGFLVVVGTVLASCLDKARTIPTNSRSISSTTVVVGERVAWWAEVQWRETVREDGWMQNVPPADRRRPNRRESPKRP